MRAVPRRACVVLVMAATVLGVAACSADEDEPSVPADASASAAASAGASGSTGTPAEAAEGAADPFGAATPVTNEAPLDDFSTADRSVPSAGGAAVVQLESARVEHDGEVDRLVISTAGGLPAWSARYVEAVRIEGEPVLVEGEASLELVLTGVDPNGAEGLRREVAIDVEPDEGRIEQVSFARYVDDAVTYAVGLQAQQPFRVLLDEQSRRLVLEFAAS